MNARAKINLRLKVLALGDSGYHWIETVFQRLELADRITVSVSDGGGVELDVSGDESLIMASGPAEQNLAVLAAKSYQERADWHPRVGIRVEKLIPVGAGLGGGSADAAAVLRALNALAPAPLQAAELLSLAASIGSDVPFLVSDDVIAVGWGRGERLLALPPLPRRPVLLGIPPLHISTKEAYGWLGRSRGAEPAPPTLPGVAFSSWENAAAHAGNDFFAEVAARHPVVGAIRESMLARGARLAMLTGSGSAVFGIFDPDASPEPEPRGSGWHEIRTATASGGQSDWGLRTVRPQD